MRRIISDVADLIAGFAFKSKDFGDDYPDKVIKITHITPPNVKMKELSSVDISKYDRRKLEKYVARKGDFVFAMTGATIGKIGRIEEGEAYLNQRVMMFRPHSDIDKDFLYYILQQYEFYQYVINHIDSESAQPNISATTVGKYEFDCPDIETQKKIGSLLRDFDEKAEKNNRINENLSKQVSALYENWFINCADPSWDTVPLSDLIFFQEGPGIRNWQYVTSDGVKFINIRCISDGDINTSTANMISEDEAYGKYAHFLLQPYDIVMSCSGTLGRYAIVRPDHLPLCLNTSVIRFRPKLDFKDYSFVYGYITSKDFLQQQTVMANGSAQVNFGPTHLKQIEMINPPVKLRYDFNNIVMPIIDHMITIRSESLKLAQLRDTLLPKLMSGELDVSNLDI